jgi:hypothetical protein
MRSGHLQTLRRSNWRGVVKILSKIVNVVCGKQWEVRRTIWPYKEGYGVYNPFTRTIADTGLLQEEAQQRCDALNSKGAA